MQAEHLLATDQSPASSLSPCGSVDSSPRSSPCQSSSGERVPSSPQAATGSLANETTLAEGTSLDLQRERCQQQEQKQRTEGHKQSGGLSRLVGDEVKQMELFGVQIVALTINGKERLCLAQISNTLLREFSYNEIHNRRVALGITCVQCTPIQLEMLRRAGAMPSSSRRCGMITMREAERLCRSFLVEEQPPELPENFYFTVAHRVNYGCKGRFVPARYISSRAKCIECFYCGEFFSPNKFIFHSHRQPHSNDCNPPDSPNINSWRKHIDLDLTQEQSQDIKYAWEDVKSLFNGGTRRRAPNIPAQSATGSLQRGQQSAGRDLPKSRLQLLAEPPQREPETEQETLIDVDDSSLANSQTSQQQHRAVKRLKPWRPASQSLIQIDGPSQRQPTGGQLAAGVQFPLGLAKKMLVDPANSSPRQLFSNPHNKRLLSPGDQTYAANQNSQLTHFVAPTSGGARFDCNGDQPSAGSGRRPADQQQQQFLCPTSQQFHHQPRYHTTNGGHFASAQIDLKDRAAAASDTTSGNVNLLYGQLYSQLMMPQHHEQQAQFGPAMEAQLALRHHLWSSLLANLQTADRGSPSGQLQAGQGQQDTPYRPLSSQLAAGGESMDGSAGATAAAAASLSQMISAQLFSQQQQQLAPGQTLVGKLAPRP